MNLVNILGAIVSPLFNRGIGNIPGVLPLYRRFWKYFGFKGERLVRVNNFKLYVIARDWAVAPTMIFAHRWEPDETAIFKRYIESGMTVVDIGAYIGYHSILASKLVGDKGKVYTFEPSPESLTLLHKNIKINNCKNICVVEKAVTEKIGDATYYIVKDNPSNSSIMQSLGWHRKITVSTISLDEFMKDERVDFIKMDIEGGERAAINGMVNTIKNNPNLQMVVEVYPPGLKRAGWTLKEYVSFLSQYFHLYIIGAKNLADEVGYCDIQKKLDKVHAINLFCSRRMNV